MRDNCHNQQAATKKRPPTCTGVDGLNVNRLESRIQWRGNVRLHLTGENDESKLADVEWPVKSGQMRYGCASTGLLFDKDTGRCLQSSNVTLDLATVEPDSCSATQFVKWKAARNTYERQHLVISKRGPKPKGYVPPSESDEFDE